MSILNNNPTDPATQAANQIRQLVRQPFQQMKMSGVQGYNLIWNNRNATPQEVLAALDTDAKVVFELAALNIESLTEAATIDGITPPVIPEIPSNYTLTFNDDGSAVLQQNSSSSSAAVVSSSSSSGVLTSSSSSGS